MNNWTMDIIQNKGPQEASEIYYWQQMWWFNDQDQLDNASIEQLRHRFTNIWLPGLTAQERQDLMFLVVDKAALNSVSVVDEDVLNTPDLRLPEHYRGEYRCIKAWDRNTSEKDSVYPRWKKVSVPEVFCLYEIALRIENKRMKALRSRSTD
ncbi:unnamed protein product [Aureobasidium vineae]|uniref:Uncharacterized protein n=1 Tax=Aureobasidium vineae TaxID=2773715 RepID=A0A9N8JWE1_9PEZI|nr:unnamed protein product [Aureobasidium vineae]